MTSNAVSCSQDEKSQYLYLTVAEVYVAWRVKICSALATYLDVRHVLAMAVLHEMATRSNNDIHAIHTGAHRQLGVAHITPHMCEDLGLQAEFGDCLTVLPALLARSWRCELDVVYAKLIQSFGNLDFGLGIEEGVGELLSFT